MAKKKWTVNCTWMMSGTDYVEADTAEEAGKIASSPDRPLPSDRNYIECSYQIESIEEE